MSEAQDQATYRRITAMKDPLAIAREIADATRIQSMTEPIPRGASVAGYCDGDLVWETYYLKPDYFLVLFCDDTQAEDPDPFTRAGLKDCQAWIFKYDRQHSRLSIEARNAETGDRSFSMLARRLLSD